MTEAAIALSIIALLAFFVRGATGSASAMVFNAVFVSAYALGWTGSLTLRDGLYWIAMANGVAAVMMLTTLARSLRLETVTVRYILGMLPVNVAFTVLLTRVESGSVLAIGLAAVVTLSGLYMVARPRLRPAKMTTINRLAFPVGMTAGVLGGLYGMAGPVAIQLFSRAADDPSLFRMRLTIVASSTTLVRLVTLGSQGELTPERLVTAAWTIPAVGIGIAVGMRVHRYLKPGPFRLALGLLIAMSGVLALIQSL